jgi:hypothetical protein
VQAFTFSNVIREASGSKSKLGGHVWGTLILYDAVRITLKTFSR